MGIVKRGQIMGLRMGREILMDSNDCNQTLVLLTSRRYPRDGLKNMRERSELRHPNCQEMNGSSFFLRERDRAI